jgi:hypothetical protein
VTDLDDRILCRRGTGQQDHGCANDRVQFDLHAKTSGWNALKGFG